MTKTYWRCSQEIWIYFSIGLLMTKLHRFTVFESYVDVIEHLAKEDLGLAQELSYAIIMYGIYWKTPHMDDSRLIEHWDRIVDTLDRFRQKSIRNLKHWVNNSFEEEVNPENEFFEAIKWYAREHGYD